ncbi:hypothetical protein ACWPO0_08275 [Acinetobacter nosocomialis]|uniref:hypothetical protein n=1 Tax=Acinetobacter calcoaceticus/baumannii complex TaxID=909768 RepID=UPI000DE613EC|nr:MULTISPECIES: hypothetical protein [Acinetobacter calcoaceticus/baumannii complex]MCG6604135.1 hypothetical protein [Acinetobacter baumannii]SSV40422.1 Uncharacterised protein [Acinetobacter nosocomialis]
MEFQIFDLDEKSNIDLKGKIVLPPYFEILKEHIESFENLSSFINLHSRTKKWLIVSDYALDDDSKNGNFITFTIIPHYIAIDKLMGLVRKLQPKDIKKTKKINNAFIEFLRSRIFFNICIELPSQRERIIGGGLDYFKLLYTCLGQNTNKSDIEKQCNYFINKLNRSPKLPLHTDIDLIASIVSIIQVQIFKSVPDVENICWLSDRDKILTTLGQVSKERLTPMIFHLINYRSQILFGYLNLPFKRQNTNVLSFGLPESEGSMWYDSLVRIPDFIAGSLADNNQKEKFVSKEIFRVVLEEVISNRDQNAIFRLNLTEEGVSFTTTAYKLSRQ